MSLQGSNKLLRPRSTRVLSTDLVRGNVSDATALPRIRHLLVEDELTQMLLDEIGIELCERGLMMKEGTYRG